ncbi:hypothetical protein [Bacteroides caecimuris]|uniref:hypothetical protein n=2 Tax=Bacteroidales TaxID=171549 RepID=UPI00265ED3B4|nr:hypothetical protein [Bacteroides caecimuris]
MSKGFADFLIVSARLLDREIERELEGVEMPLFKEEFYEWLKTQENLSEGSIVNYKRWLENADELIYVNGKDFYTLFKKSFYECDYATCDELIRWYDGLLTEEIEQAKKKIFDETPEAISNWRSAFRKHADFLSLCMANAIDEAKKMNERIQKSRESASTLFLENRFFGWLISPDNLNKVVPDTAESYVSLIKSVNKKLFCKTGYDILAMLPVFIKARNTAKINEMFDALDGKLTERIKEMNETEMSLRQLENSRSALRRYSEFIKSLTVTE